MSVLPFLLIFAIFYFFVILPMQRKRKLQQNAPTAQDAPHEQTALTECPACKISVSTQATRCPKCGHPFPMSPRTRQRNVGLVVGLLFLALGVWLVQQPRYGLPWAPHDDTLPWALFVIAGGLFFLFSSYFRK
jgi:uncharacterized paraquat-inducible protein A